MQTLQPYHIPIPLTEDTFFVSSSFLESYTPCSRAGAYYKLHNRVADKEKPALTFGSHIHSALEMHYRQKEFGLSLEQIFSKIFRLLELEFQREPNNTEGDWRTFPWAVELYTRYAEKYGIESYHSLEYPTPIPCKYCCKFDENGKVHYQPIHVDETYGPTGCLWCNGTRQTRIMTEVPFAYQIGTIIYQGRQIRVFHHGFIDHPVAYNNGIYSRDFKTTSQLGDSFFVAMKMSGQHKGYANALEKTINQPVFGYIVTAIRSKQPPLYVATSSDFIKAAKWWDESFAEEVFNTDPTEGAEWEQDAMAIIERFFWEHSRGYFPKTPDHQNCVKYGRCQFYQICTSYPADQRLMLLNSNWYKDKPKTGVEL